MSKYNWKNKNILIADDDILNFELLKLMLRNTDINIIHFNNGQAVIDYFEKNSAADIIIMDIQMPVLDGKETTKMLRENGLTIPIIALTALNTSSEQSKYREIGFDEIVEKPIRKEAFLLLIEKSLK
jgi:CheY-like chemotaxis protein